MRVLITGATGKIGNQLGLKLVKENHELVVISRSRKKAQQALEFPAEIIEHDLSKYPLPEAHFEGIDAVIHLMGESMDGRWTAKKKELILNSRIQSSQNLIKNLPETIKVLVSASAQGIYGDRANEDLAESASLGDNFLALVCAQWEAPFKDLQITHKKIRAVQLRIGLVLDSQYGVLKKLIPLFQKGPGGELGDGRQYMSWIASVDLIQIITESLTNENYKGPINCSTPLPVTNSEFTTLLCQNLNIFKSLPVPKVALKLVLGEMSQIVLSSVKMKPQKLIDFKFNYKFNDLSDYFKNELEFFKNGYSYLKQIQYIQKPLPKVFEFFSQAENLEKITPEILNFKIEKMSSAQIEKGTIIDYKLKIHGLPVGWRTHIKEWQPPQLFVDEQIKGPYSQWHHTHQFEKIGEGTLMRDFVHYKLPIGFFGNLVASSFVQNDVEKIFNYRREIIGQDQMII